ncbi:hypothetical protein J2Y45_006767 [Dyadobacter sp. BE34]|uniref:DUF3784 domain-containing protein n=1 Tax=Dyadobacter fermentans TaxID=94254 RepID=A0ABU1R8K7_9BACT|nr:MULTISPECIES: hypothetical protein [Dyadobacter]MDR6809744.1 hypothetical protein [Dyadobacter fermentans]MDR7047434.1 hypothetical protein [Dyadobacter sp. BE242]MDR7201603.1 hypothetical protein [Dyadobacter sp. BE34]MDR7219473.1 hypothetical protein [Dyadobacter sp. BE31]MDR7267240.1 hypothetical protein [Dyadobacter sp. BE32]
MNWVLASVGILVILLGIAIWRFGLVGWFSNVPKGGEIIDKEKAAKLGGSYLSLVGMCFVAFGYAVENLPDQTIMVIVACYIPANMVVLVSYLVAQSKNMRR